MSKSNGWVSGITQSDTAAYRNILDNPSKNAPNSRIVLPCFLLIISCTALGPPAGRASFFPVLMLRWGCGLEEKTVRRFLDRIWRSKAVVGWLIWRSERIPVEVRVIESYYESHTKMMPKARCCITGVDQGARSNPSLSDAMVYGIT